jgi:multidrug efflux pump
MRRSVGTAMLWGAFGVSLFGIFLTPVFFYTVDWLTKRRVEPAVSQSSVAASLN